MGDLDKIDYEQVVNAFNELPRAFVYLNEDVRSLPTDKVFATNGQISLPKMHLIVAKDPDDPSVGDEYAERDITVDELAVLVDTALIAEGIDGSDPLAVGPSRRSPLAGG